MESRTRYTWGGGGYYNIFANFTVFELNKTIDYHSDRVVSGEIPFELIWFCFILVVQLEHFIFTILYYLNLYNIVI